MNDNSNTINPTAFTHLLLTNKHHHLYQTLPRLPKYHLEYTDVQVIGSNGLSFTTRVGALYFSSPSESLLPPLLPLHARIYS
mmetsp:Transcript_18432/g.27494  ORF Transcript_18432/g.27494 Transcript_18432/m.27494 type:complete len:82 (-) Transcript_18432:818-1063(-)